MNVIFVMLPLAVTLAAMFVVLCLRAIRDGQFDDLETPAIRVVLEEDDEG